jgi:peptidoglycan/xylan/chitin deacetylase (PgdA/CDA1 family)
MKKIINDIFFWMAYISGAFKVFRFINRKKVLIIVYHNPSPELFEKHIIYLIKHYNIVSLSDFIDNQKNISDCLPDYSIIITIDDGHRNNYHLLPVIKKYNIPVTIYLTSEIVTTNRKFWWFVPKDTVEISHLKKLSNSDKDQFLLKKYGFKQTDEFPENERVALNHAEILEMRDYVDFQCHTSFHPILTRCNESEFENELLNSKTNLSKLLNKDVTHLSYPNGSYNSEIVERLKSFGYKSARTTKLGLNTAETNPFVLKIIGVSEKEMKHRFELDLLGIPLYFINIYRKFWKI